MAERNLSVDHTTIWRWVQRVDPRNVFDLKHGPGARESFVEEWVRDRAATYLQETRKHLSQKSRLA